MVSNYTAVDKKERKLKNSASFPTFETHDIKAEKKRERLREHRFNSLVLDKKADKRSEKVTYQETNKKYIQTSFLLQLPTSCATLG